MYVYTSSLPILCIALLSTSHAAAVAATAAVAAAGGKQSLAPFILYAAATL